MVHETACKRLKQYINILSYRNTRMCNRRPYDSNHESLKRVNLHFFNNLFARKLIKFALSIFQLNIPTLSRHKYYFPAYSDYGREIKKCFCKKIIKFLTYSITAYVRQYSALNLLRGLNSNPIDLIPDNY